MLEKLKNKFLLATLIAIACFGCKKNTTGPLYPSAYMQYVLDPENGLIQKKTIGGFTLVLQYKPIEFMALQVLKNENVTKREIDNLKEKFSDNENFTLRIESKNNASNVLKQGINNKEAYYQRLDYLTADVIQDFKLINNTDTIFCALHHFERYDGLAPYVDIVLAFPKARTHSDLRFEYDDHIFGLGKIKFIVNEKDIQHIPELKTLY